MEIPIHVQAAKTPTAENQNQIGKQLLARARTEHGYGKSIDSIYRVPHRLENGNEVVADPPAAANAAAAT